MTKARSVLNCAPARCLGTQILSPEISDLEFLVVPALVDGSADPTDSRSSCRVGAMPGSLVWPILAA